jgi:hypothetical protein
MGMEYRPLTSTCCALYVVNVSGKVLVVFDIGAYV